MRSLVFDKEEPQIEGWVSAPYISTINPTATTRPKNGVVLPLIPTAVALFSTFLLGVAEGLPVLEAGGGRSVSFVTSYVFENQRKGNGFGGEDAYMVCLHRQYLRARSLPVSPRMSLRR